MKFGLGHLPDVPDARDLKIQALGIAVAATPSSVDLSSHIDTIRNQSTTSSCVGQAFARVLHMRASLAGEPIPFPSALGIYSLARRMNRPLADFGCYPRDAADGMRKFGIVAERRWPFVVAEVNTLLPWDVYQHGEDAAVDGYYRVDSYGQERLDLLHQALAAGYPIAYAQRVDQAFEDYSGGVLGAFSGKDLGGHMTALVGYGPGYFIGCNSWGTNWGEGGLYRISDERVASDYCSDFYVLTHSPTVVT